MDETPAIETVVKADNKRESLLAEEFEVMKEAEDASLGAKTYLEWVSIFFL